jgi:hypothetical protein
MSDDLKTRLGYLADVVTPWGQHIAIDARNRIEELEAKLRDMALDCLAADGQAAEAYQAQLAAEAKLAKAVAALKRSAEGWSNALELNIIASQHRTSAGILRDEARSVLAELKGEDRG